MRQRTLATVFVIVIVLSVSGPLKSQTLQAAMHADFERELSRISDRLDGVLGYAIEDLTTGEAFYRNPDLVFPTASSIKLAVLLEVLRQAQENKLSLSEKHTVMRSEMVGGDPILYMLGDGTVTMTLRDLAIFMIVLSDDTATNILIDRVGMENINAEIQRLGLKESKLRRHMIDLEAARRGSENVSSPRELSMLLVKVRAGGVLDPDHTKEYFSILKLPKDSLFDRALPATTKIADKSGALDGVRCDAGIIEIPNHPFVMTIMTTYLRSSDEGERTIEEIARRTDDYFERLGRASAYGRFIEEK